MKPEILHTKKTYNSYRGEDGEEIWSNYSLQKLQARFHKFSPISY